MLAVGALLLAGGCSDRAERASCGMPRAMWARPACLDCGLAPIANRIALDARDRILWNGRAISPGTLDAYLAQVPRMQPVPLTFFQNTAAFCGAAEVVRRAMDERLPCRTDAVCAEGDWNAWHPLGAVQAAIG